MFAICAANSPGSPSDIDVPFNHAIAACLTKLQPDAAAWLTCGHLVNMGRSSTDCNHTGVASISSGIQPCIIFRFWSCDHTGAKQPCTGAYTGAHNSHEQHHPALCDQLCRLHRPRESLCIHQCQCHCHCDCHRHCTCTLLSVSLSPRVLQC